MMTNLLLQNINIIICFCLLVLVFFMLKIRKTLLEEKAYYQKKNNEINESKALTEKQILESEIISLKNKLKQLENENGFLKNLLLKEQKTGNTTVNLKLFQNISKTSDNSENEFRLRSEIIDLETRANNIIKERNFLLKNLEDEKKVSNKNPFFQLSDK